MILLLAACSRPTDGSADPSPDRAPARGPAPGLPAGPDPARFATRSVGPASGLTLVNVSGDPVAKLAIPENLGQGAAALDFDGDGDLDLFIANGDVFPGQQPAAPTRCALYRNDGDLRFTDVSLDALPPFEGWVHGAWAVDFDGDGWTDVYLTCFRRPNLFLRNRGDGTFEDATEAWGGADPGPSTAAAFFDADLDGDLDLYVGNYVLYDPADPPNGGRPCDWKGLQVSCGPLGTTPAADTFYENVDGRLVEATARFGFDAVEPSYALAVIASDLDQDGDLDLFVANDSRPNFLWLNEGRGRFREVALASGCAMNEAGRAQSGMGVDVADVDGDGRVDIFVTHFSHDHNTLYRNETRPGAERPRFVDSTYAMRLGEASFPFLSWGTRILDLDRDGWPDIVVVSGHVYPQVDGSAVGTTYAQRNQVFANLGPEGPAGLVRFAEVVFPPGDGWSRVLVSRGLVAADFDEDGICDFLIVEMDTPPTLLQGVGRGLGAHLAVRLQGSGRNRDAIGARVTVTARNGRRQVLERSYGAGYLSTSDPRLVFGLGADAGPVPLVEIRWPDGTTQRHEEVPVGRTWTFVQETGERR
jgi:hypothetical protein